MILYELFEDFENNDPLRVATTATLAQIRSDVEDDSYRGEFTVKALLDKLKDNGVRITRQQLIELVKEEPWSNLIANIQGDRVEFKNDDDGNDEIDNSEPEDDQYNLEQMSKRAAKKPSGL